MTRCEKKIKPVTAFVIVDTKTSEVWDQQEHCIAFTEKECKRQFVMGTHMTWKEFEKMGWACIQVKAEPVKAVKK